LKKEINALKNTPLQQNMTPTKIDPIDNKEGKEGTKSSDKERKEETKSSNIINV